ncbi:MAG: hypothetical protein ABIN97_10475 [Ginsengibacter sp.]
MQTILKYTVVVLPDNTNLEVSYFCSDKKIMEKEKKSFTYLIVQLYDCHCSYKVNKELLKDDRLLEAIVQKTVINAKGHLC